jgi:hypothetical protein
MVGAVLRILAAYWSEGYAMHDDHFVTVEPSYSWSLGLDYGGWIHQSTLPENPLFYNYLYPKILFLIFKLGHSFGITSPKSLMLLIRLLHGLFSLVSVFFGYQIAKKLFTAQKAIQIAWILACFWLFPFIGVRNLVEVVCIPFVMMGFYFVLSTTKNRLIIAALCFSIATSIRFQTILLPIGIGIAWLYLRQFYRLVLFVISYLVFFCLIDGTLGMYYFHQPFGHILNYVRININLHPEHSQGYLFKYSLILIGLGLSMGVHWLLGYVHSFQKKYLILSLPLLLFIFIHSLIPNQQERFIFPIIPLYIIVGHGCFDINKFSGLIQKILNHPVFFKLFMVLNGIMLLLFTSYYPKKSRVELMDYFYQHKIINQTILVDYRPYNYFILLPNLYMNYQNNIHYVFDQPSSNTSHGYDNVLFFSPNDLTLALKGSRYLVLYDATDSSRRLQSYTSCGYSAQMIGKVESSFFDKLLHRLNPVNDEGTFFIYQLKEK